MDDSIYVPKEKFLVDYFEKKKTQKEVENEQKRFEDILFKIQLKVDQKDLDSLIKMPVDQADKKIDELTPSETISVIKETIEKLKE